MNPLFPLNEYVPDGEPHVFGDRVYLYGSHDRANGDRFCMDDYTVYSAPVSDLTNWTCHGIAYRKSQDPRSRNGRLVDFYAPDCVKGNDGRFYLYYFAAGPNTTAFGPMAVAVSDKPEGPFEYLSDIKYKDGFPVLKYLTNDPAVINDNGRIWLYYGWGLGRDFGNRLFAPFYDFVLSKLCKRTIENIRSAKPSVLSCAVVELEEDMCTVKGEPKAVLDSITTAKKNTDFYHHAFYEAASIRKFGDTYYLIYSSGQNNELAYATSKYPDRGFEYKGVLISGCDLGYKGNRQRKAPAGTIHGSVEFIDGRYYVFYHRTTNNTDFSRQACAEPIEMVDGKFLQAEITTQGVGKPLETKGKYSAAYCCNLYNKKTRNVQGNGHGNQQPNIAYRDKEHFITAMKDRTTVGFKYFDFDSPKRMKVTLRGSGGKVVIKAKEDDILASFAFETSYDWKTYEVELKPTKGIHPLFFVFSCKGRSDFKEFEFE